MSLSSSLSTSFLNAIYSHSKPPALCMTDDALNVWFQQSSASHSLRGPPRYPKLEPTGKLPWQTYFYLDCPALGMSIPVPSHPSMISELDHLNYLFTVSRPLAEDGVSLVMSEKDAISPATTPQLRQTLARGGVAILENCANTNLHGFSFSGSEEDAYTLAYPEALVACQNHYTRNPITHETLTFRAFLALADDPACALNLLSFPMRGRAARPRYVSQLADDRRALHLRPIRDRIPDINDYTSWAILTHGLTFTPMHQDAGGYSTYMAPFTGRKVWFTLQWVDPQSETDDALLIRRAKCTAVDDYYSIEYSKTPPWVNPESLSIDWAMWEAQKAEFESERVARWHVLLVAPGTNILQPSGAVHAVYNPEASAAWGGHFLSRESLPRAERALFTEAILNGANVNAFHPALRLVHSAMALDIVESMSRPQQHDPLYTHCSSEELAALARLLFHHDFYLTKEAADETRRAIYKTKGYADTYTEARNRLQPLVPNIPIRPQFVSAQELKKKKKKKKQRCI